MVQRFLVDESVSQPGAPPHRLALSPSDLHRMLIEWNQTDLDVDFVKCIHDMIDEQVIRTPDKTAIICRDQPLTYRELNERAYRLRSYLITLGVGPEKIVAVCIERSVELMVALLAIIKAGGAYLPLDPSFPAERIDFMLTDSRAMMVLTQTSLANRFESKAPQIVEVDQVLSENEMRGDVRGARGAQPTDLAYVIYTSGSTGTPKGVMVEHRNVANFFAGMDQILRGEPGVWLAVTSISFDISVLELFWTLARGFTVVLQTEYDTLLSSDEYSITEQLNTHHVTHLQCTPTLARLLIRSRAVAAMRSLRTLLVGGEALLPPLASQIRAATDADIYNMYGPTETTIWSTAYSIRGDEEPIPIGRPIANTQIYILDDNLQPVMVGEPGEIYIGGVGVTRGYWNRPELTAQRFLPDPFRRGEAGRLYKTGDRAYYRTDGVIQFLGRVDHQVKIRGFRVECGEIETVLGSHPGVQDVVVKINETVVGNPQLAAYVVPARGCATDPNELQIFLRQKLPDYMVPSAFVVLEILPTTPNGKVDREALPLPHLSISNVAAGGAVRTDLENIIAQIWQDALGVDAVGLDQNIFDLGANSLSVAEATISLSQAIKRPIRLVDFFTYPTVSSLAAYLSGAREVSNYSRSAATRGAARRESLLQRARADRRN